MVSSWKQSLGRASRWVLGLALAASAGGAQVVMASEPVRAGEAPGEKAQVEGQGGSEAVNPTRQLEAEIEEYPAPAEPTTEDAETRIPEAIEVPGPPPKAEGARRGATNAPIDVSEVERVMGSDARLLDLEMLDAAQVTLLQQRLRERGHYLGRIDGIVGPQTRAAVASAARERFTLSQRLLQQGQITSELAAMIGLSGVTPPAGGQSPDVSSEGESPAGSPRDLNPRSP